MDERIDNERGVLAAAIISAKAQMDVLTRLNPEHFIEPKHRALFKAIRAQAEEDYETDVQSVWHRLPAQDKGQFDGIRELYEMAAEPVIAIKSAIDRIIYQHRNDRVMQIMESARQRLTANDGAEELYKDVMGQLELIDNDQAPTGLCALGDTLDATRRDINDVTEGNKPAGMKTGYIDLDAVTGGFTPGQMVIICARPGIGKTALALNIAEKMARRGANIAIFSLEMGVNEINKRMISAVSGVPHEYLKDGLPKQIQEKGAEHIDKAIEVLKTENLFIDDTPGQTMYSIKAECKKLSVKYPLDMVVIDYMQLIETAGKSENRTQEVTAISRKCKLLARELNCVVLALCQVSRMAAVRSDKMPQLADLRESGAIEQDADIVIGIGEATDNVCPVEVLKNRSGQQGRLELLWQNKFVRFKNVNRFEPYNGPEKF